MITLFIGIWLQPRNQPTFSVCQLPASSLASTFYSPKLSLFFPPCLSPCLLSFLSPNSFPSSPPFLNKFIYLYPPPHPTPSLFLFLYVLWFPWELSSSRRMPFLLKKNHTHKKKTGTHTHLNEHAHTIVLLYAHACTWLFHVDYLGMSTSGSNNSNICLLRAPRLPACGNRNLWNQINYLCQFPQDKQNTLLITNLYRRLDVPSDLRQCFSVCLQLCFHGVCLFLA